MEGGTFPLSIPYGTSTKLTVWPGGQDHPRRSRLDATVNEDS